MTKMSMHEVVQQARQRLVSAGFIQMAASEIAMDDKLYNGVTADVTRAVPVVNIQTWRNGGIYILCRYYSGNIGNTYDADKLLWVVPRS